MRTSLPSLISSRSAIGLASAIAVILLAANFTITNAQQQLTTQPREIENGGTITRTFQSTTDGFRLQVPKGWVIHTVNNSASSVEAEGLQGYRILAQFCQGEQQREAVPNANSSNSISTNNRCQVGQGEEVIYLVRYPDLNARLQLVNNATSHNMTTDNILSYHLQKLQQVGYRGIHIVNSTQTTINLTNAETNQTMAKVPAKLVEITYTTNLAPQEIKRGYFILTATNATTPNPGTTKGYSVFYEGTSIGAQQRTTMISNNLSVPISLPPAVRQVFDSFELIAAPQVTPQQQTAGTTGGTEDSNKGGNGGEHGEHDNDGAHDNRDNGGNGGEHDSENGERHDQGDGNRGHGLAKRIIDETEDMLKRLLK